MLCRRFPLAEIKAATNDFSAASVIGRGGFGVVYRGSISGLGATTSAVAIKRLNPESSRQGEREFQAEIETLSKLQHTHLVSLIGFCDEGAEMVLVYEYMPYGTLADHLYKDGREEDGSCIYHLTWEQRLNICIGAACGLNYLHTGTGQGSIIHRDVKTTNILLDDNWVAKISDFGLSKISNKMGLISQSHVSTDVKGTFGYLDPNYFFTRRITKKTDVYAFGVVLCEVLCARPAVDMTLAEEQHSLAVWVLNCIKKEQLHSIIDPFLRERVPPHSLKMFAKLAIKCLQKKPKKRPTMSEVVGSLELVLASQGNASQQKGIFGEFSLCIARMFASLERMIFTIKRKKEKKRKKKMMMMMKKKKKKKKKNSWKDEVLEERYEKPTMPLSEMFVEKERTREGEKKRMSLKFFRVNSI